MKIAKILDLGTSPEAIAALITWPKFSVTSYRMLKSISALGLNPATIIDVGGNVGQFSVAAKKTFPSARLFAFEPHPHCYEKLRKALAFDHNARLFQVAIGDDVGDVTLNLNAHAHSSSILPLSVKHRDLFPDATEVQSVQVPLSTLDVLLEGDDFPRPALLKIDVQGYDAAVIRGAPKTLKRVDWVIVEVSFEPMYEREVLFDGISALMLERGFRFARPVGWLEAPNSSIIVQMDALYDRIST